MILYAHHQPCIRKIGSMPFHIERGQFPTSYSQLSAKWGWSRGKVVRFLKMLENEHMIEVKIDSGITLISILDYDDLVKSTQDFRTSNGHINEHPPDSVRTVGEHPTDTVKNDKNDKNNIYISKNSNGIEESQNKPEKELHPSPNAPKWLKRKEQELKQRLTNIWLTDGELAILETKTSKAETKCLIQRLEIYSGVNPKRFKSYVDHYRVLLTFRRRELENGKKFFEHPEKGAGYYYDREIKNLNQVSH